MLQACYKQIKGKAGKDLCHASGRLVKEQVLQGITDIEDADRYLQEHQPQIMQFA